jgi:hypothetical protein
VCSKYRKQAFRGDVLDAIRLLDPDPDIRADYGQRLGKLEMLKAQYSQECDEDFRPLRPRPCAPTPAPWDATTTDPSEGPVRPGRAARPEPEAEAERGSKDITTGAVLVEVRDRVYVSLTAADLAALLAVAELCQDAQEEPATLIAAATKHLKASRC